MRWPLTFGCSPEGYEMNSKVVYIGIDRERSVYAWHERLPFTITLPHVQPHLVSAHSPNGGIRSTSCTLHIFHFSHISGSLICL